MSCYCDYENTPSFFTERELTAKKEHKCCECGHVIKPGERYENVSGKWEEFRTFKTCEKCADLRASLQDVMCPSFGDMFAEYREYLNNETEGFNAEAIIYRIQKRHNPEFKWQPN
jgi:hypothetical protein